MSNYQSVDPRRLPTDGDVDEDAAAAEDKNPTAHVAKESSKTVANAIEWNFRWMCIFFGANHACVTSCLSLATARFHQIGAWQSGILYLTYTGSAVFGATAVVKRFGGRDSLIAGMALYCFYVAAFLFATVNVEHQRSIAYIGAAIGGSGAGFLWTAQGAFFTVTAKKHAAIQKQPIEKSTNQFSAMFAFYYLSLEVVLRATSSLTGSIRAIDWTLIFGLYFGVAVVSTIGMTFVQNFEDERANAVDRQSWFYRQTATLQLLFHDPKMKHMIALNAVSGFATAFLNSYVNGQVVPVVFQSSNMIGVLTAWLSIVAATMSVVFSGVAEKYSKGFVLVMGSICFLCATLPFIVFPAIQHWSPILLILVYTLVGFGRATFESTLKAVFADFFHYEKEGAFANIILQNGAASALGFALSSGIECASERSPYCMQLTDGSLNNVLPFELLLLVCALLSIAGYIAAARIHKAEMGRKTLQGETANLV